MRQLVLWLVGADQFLWGILRYFNYLQELALWHLSALRLIPLGDSDQDEVLVAADRDSRLQ